MYQVSGLSQEVAELKVQQGRILRDKSSQTKQLEDALAKLANQEEDHGKVHCLLWANTIKTICLIVPDQYKQRKQRNCKI